MRRHLWIIIASFSLAIGFSISLLGHVQNYIADYYKGDWFVLWLAARAPVEQLYSNLDKLPFVYPPTALFLLKPFGLVSSWVGLGLWSLLGISAIFLVARKIASPSAIILALLMPAAFHSLLAGQTSLIVSALMIAGFAHPGWWGAAAVLKPQSLVALPFTGEWGKLAVAGAVAVLLVMVSVALWGTQPWLNWFASLDDFQALTEAKGLDRWSVGLPSQFYPLGVVLGAAGVWITREADVLDRFAALACGAALISPYMLNYDLAGLSIAAMAMLLDRERSVARWIAAGWVVSGLLPTIGVILLLSVIAWERGFQMKAMKTAKALP